MDYLLITVGTVIYGIGVSLFLDPNNLAPGGVTGIAMILNRLTGLPTGTGILLINIPILAAGLWKFGLRFLVSTLYATFLSSVFTNFFARFGALTMDPVLASLAGGAVCAAGLALVFRAGATTGGTDIIVKFLRQKYRHLKTGRLFFILDVLIVLASLLVFDDINTILYAMLAVVVISIVLTQSFTALMKQSWSISSAIMRRRSRSASWMSWKRASPSCGERAPTATAPRT